MTLADRIGGCILGGALGDALGGPYENCPAPVALWADAPLRLSDDTQLTLATCESIVRVQRPDPECIAAAFATLFQQRRLRGLGASTFKALQELAAGGHWALVGGKGDRSAGNGPATRIAPLAFLLDHGADLRNVRGAAGIAEGLAGAPSGRRACSGYRRFVFEICGDGSTVLKRRGSCRSIGRITSSGPG